MPFSNLTTDHLGTPIAATSPGGTLLWQGGFEPFGADWSGAGAAGVFLRFLRFPGQWEEEAWAGVGEGLYYNVHRWYEVGVGRYTRVDPIGLDGGFNLYSYTFSSSLTHADPLGLASFLCRRPLGDHEPKPGNTRIGPDIWGNPFYHEYACVVNGSAVTCGGHTIAKRSFFGLFGPGRPTNPSEGDRFDSSRCRQVEETCMARTLPLLTLLRAAILSMTAVILASGCANHVDHTNKCHAIRQEVIEMQPTRWQKAQNISHDLGTRTGGLKMLKTFGFFTILAQLACGSTLIAQGPNPSQTPGVRVVVDSRIELMSMVQLLSDYHLVSRYESPYKRDAKAYFASFSGHPAVALFREMSEAGFAFNNVPAVMLARTEVPALERRADVRQDVRDAAGGEERIEELIQALRRFAEDTDFLAFYRAHSGTYSIAAEKTRPDAESALRILENYTGLTFEASTVVLGPLLHDGGFAAIYDIDGQPEAYALIGPIKSDPDRVPSFGGPGRLLSLVGHEFAHLAVDPLTSRYQQVVEGYSAAHAPIAEAMRRNAYGQWTVVVSEHIIRAITTRIVFREHGEEAGRRELDSEVQRGFAYVPRLVELLEEYEGERSRYPTLAEYFPRLLSAFETPAAPL